MKILTERYGEQQQNEGVKRKEEDNFKDVCYNILSFQNRQSTIIQLVVLAEKDKPKTVYLKSGDDLNSSIRCAKSWGKDQNGFALSYL